MIKKVMAMVLILTLAVSMTAAETVISQRQERKAREILLWESMTGREATGGWQLIS